MTKTERQAVITEIKFYLSELGLISQPESKPMDAAERESLNAEILSMIKELSGDAT